MSQLATDGHVSAFLGPEVDMGSRSPVNQPPPADKSHRSIEDINMHPTLYSTGHVKIKGKRSKWKLMSATPMVLELHVNWYGTIEEKEDAEGTAA